MGIILRKLTTGGAQSTCQIRFEQPGRNLCPQGQIPQASEQQTHQEFVVNRPEPAKESLRWLVTLAAGNRKISKDASRVPDEQKEYKEYKKYR